MASATKRRPTGAGSNARPCRSYQVVLFLDTRPDDPAQREAFRKYMEHGGAWMGFHFAGFALTPSKYPAGLGLVPQRFLGAGSYVSNTWRPTLGGASGRGPRASGDRAACRRRSRPRRASGTAGSGTCAPTPTSGSCSRSIPRAFRSAPVPSRTRSGTAATTRSCGPTALPDGLHEHGAQRHGLRAQDEPGAVVHVLRRRRRTTLITAPCSGWAIGAGEKRRPLQPSRADKALAGPEAREPRTET